ncbi:hypothetical protein [Streptomyces sp. KR80]|uniref:hypothetical protein n=1 Tax=Streptomyces sp. KR80 TaxID=3457426 RepID=UPI003FD14AE3
MNLHIAFKDYAALRQRCEVAPVRTADDNPHYEDGAVIPAGDWQPLDPDLAERLRPNEETLASTLVELVKLPDNEHLTPEQIIYVATGLTPQASNRTDYLGRAASAPKMLTTTINPASNRRIGLHVDNWDRLPNATRSLSRRRLCINLGPGTRYLLLAHLTIQSISRTLHPGPNHADRCPPTDDVRRYVAEGRPLHCQRIRLEPGDGYIAPTELLPHEGSTDDQPQLSTAAFWLGRWPRRVLGSLV